MEVGDFLSRSGCSFLHLRFSSPSGNFTHGHSQTSFSDLWAAAAPKHKYYRQSFCRLCIWRLSTDLCLPSGNGYMEWYGSVVWTPSFIFNTLLPGGDSPVLSAVIANWFCSLFLLVARHKSKCLSGPRCSLERCVCVCICVCVCVCVMGVVKVLFGLGECQQLIQPLISRPLLLWPSVTTQLG